VAKKEERKKEERKKKERKKERRIQVKYKSVDKYVGWPNDALFW